MTAAWASPAGRAPHRRGSTRLLGRAERGGHPPRRRRRRGATWE